MPKKKKKSWKERQRERQKKQRSGQPVQETQKANKAKKKPRKWPKGKVVLGISLIVIVLGVYAVWQYAIVPAIPKSFTVIYIRSDGSVAPSNASISNVGNNDYALTADIYGSVVIERDTIVVNGANHVLQGQGDIGSNGIVLSGRSNVTITNIELKNFDHGVYLYSASGNVLSQNRLWTRYAFELISALENTVQGNTITGGSGAIGLSDSLGNTLTENYLESNTYGISLTNSSDNSISKNTVTNSNGGAIGLVQSSGNSISGNTITNSNEAISISQSYDNKVTENSLTNNPMG
jgi:parallel beta-helix repeat protein